MGQENQKIQLTQYKVQDKNKRKRIFTESFRANPFNQPEICPFQHLRHTEDFKVCSQCQDINDPNIYNFRKMKQHSYQPKSVKLKLPKRTQFSSYNFPEQKIVDKQGPIHYYNAWSLPIQKCYHQKVNDSTAITAEELQGRNNSTIIRNSKKPNPVSFILQEQRQQESVDYSAVPKFSNIDNRGRKNKLLMFD